MHFFDDSLLPENQEKLVIQVAPYGPNGCRRIPTTFRQRRSSKCRRRWICTTPVPPYCTYSSRGR